MRQFGTLPDLDLINDLVSALRELVPGYTPAEILQWPSPAITPAGDKENRQDLRHLPFFTIDGASTRDLDDALWAQKLPGDEIELFVAVADMPAQQIMDADGRLWCLAAEVEVLLASADWKLNRIEFAVPVLRLDAGD